MLTLRCTRRVLTRLRATPSSAVVTPTTRLGDWYAGWVPMRSPQVLFISERTLASVVVAYAPSATLLPRWVAATGELLGALGIEPEAVEEELLAMHDVTFGATANRRVLGSLNEAIFMFDEIVRRRGAGHRGATLADASLELAERIYSPTKYRRPSDLVRELFADDERRALH
jgi:hypothetical protein